MLNVTFSRWTPVVLLTTVGVAVAGCQRGYEYPTARVVGRVTYKNKPVPSGTVMFVPDGNGPTATGELNSDGTYTLTTYESEDGAVIDTHKVSVTALSFRPNALPEEAALPPPLVPEKFLSHLSSGLTAEVKDVPENVIDFALTD